MRNSTLELPPQVVFTTSRHVDLYTVAEAIKGKKGDEKVAVTVEFLKALCLRAYGDDTQLIAELEGRINELEIEQDGFHENTTRLDAEW